MKVIRNTLRIIMIVLLFPWVIRELGEYIEGIHGDDMYWGGKE